MTKVALHIICKDENDQLKRILNDYGKFFDEVVIAYDDINAIDGLQINEKVKLLKYSWCDDFAHKRNFVVEHTESPFYLRIDTDDEIKNPENIRAIVEKMNKLGVDCVMAPYFYSEDIDGNCNSKHWRETFLRKSDKWRWNKTIHENIYVPEGVKYNAIRDNTVAIIHKMTFEHALQSADRNLRILMKEFTENKENTDPRTISYIGRMFLGFYNKPAQAIPFLQLLVQKTGWDDDRYYGWIDLARAHFLLGKYETAIACCNEAMVINTEFPDSYLTLCEIYIAKNDHQKAVHWGEVGITKKEPDTQLAVDPSIYGVRSLINLAIAHFGIGDFVKAKNYFDIAYKKAPNNPFLKDNEKMFNEGFENYSFITAFSKVVVKVQKDNPERLRYLAESLPDSVMQDERLQAFYISCLPVNTGESNHIAIFCGVTLEEWGPASVATGVGGSEEAVIYLSKEFEKIGYKVTIFNNCGRHAGNYGNIKYVPYWKFNHKDNFNILISWRNNLFSTNKINARKKLVWLHDVVSNFDKGDADKVIVLSKFHKDIIGISDNDCFISSNGINLRDFDIKGIERQPHRMIYTSSYDRGLEHLLKMWPEVRKEVPDAELHVFYGWNTYDYFTSIGMRDGKFKEYLTPLLSQDGVTDHGRVGHKKLAREFLKSKFWVYPCHFEEISCISAMKAQAAGCVPVCTDYAALSETVKDGVIVHGKAGEGTVNANFKSKLIEALKEQPVVSIDKEQFGWDKVAKSWIENLFFYKVNQCGR